MALLVSVVVLLAATGGISAVNISCDSDKLCQDVRSGDHTDRPAAIVYLPRGLPRPAEKYCIDATGGSDSSGPIYDYCDSCILTNRAECTVDYLAQKLNNRCINKVACVGNTGECQVADQIPCPVNDTCYQRGSCDPKTGNCPDATYFGEGATCPLDRGSAAYTNDPCAYKSAQCTGGQCTNVEVAPVQCTAGEVVTLFDGEACGIWSGGRGCLKGKFESTAADCYGPRPDFGVRMLGTYYINVGVFQKFPMPKFTIRRARDAGTFQLLSYEAGCSSRPLNSRLSASLYRDGDVTLTATPDTVRLPAFGYDVSKDKCSADPAVEPPPFRKVEVPTSGSISSLTFAYAGIGDFYADDTFYVRNVVVRCD